MHKELYAALYQTHEDYQAVDLLHQAPRLLDLTWLSLPPESPLLGQTIQDLGIRTQTGATVVGVMRHGTLQPNPAADFASRPAIWSASLASASSLRRLSPSSPPYARGNSQE
jgi:CPA2 family monovalent cation:H+ antiporter-2